MDLFDFLLTEPLAAAPLDDVAAAWTRHLAASAGFGRPVDRAIAGGFAADRLGFAFLSGYQEALRALVPDLPSADMAALCATEEGGGHPSAIRAQLVERDGGWLVNGEKSFVTNGTFARRLVVIASVGRAPDGRNRLRAVLVDAAAEGVSMANRPELPFAPEVPHARVRLTDVPARLLPGDGYLDYLKPFRTIEDVHVLAAVLGWLVRVARESGWPPRIQQRLLTVLAALRGLALDAPSSPGGHIALGGTLDAVAAVLAESETLWELADQETRRRWERDRPLLDTAGRAREQRLTAAWRFVSTKADQTEPGSDLV